MKISTPSTAASIAIVAVWLITAICGTSIAGSNELLVDEHHNPLTAAVLAIDKDSYKLVRLETLNYDHDVRLIASPLVPFSYAISQAPLFPFLIRLKSSVKMNDAD